VLDPPTTLNVTGDGYVVGRIDKHHPGLLASHEAGEGSLVSGIAAD
jgi:hypothetical protein